MTVISSGSTGETSTAIAYVDDGYGRPLEEALEAALRRRGIKIDIAVGYAAADPQFDLDATRAFLSGLHPREVVTLEE